MAWKKLFCKGAGNHGTLAFFKNRLGRTAVSHEPKKSVDATIEFFDTVTKGHWLGCACEILKITSLDDPVVLPPQVEKGSPREKLAYVQNLARKVVDRLSLVESAFVNTTSDTANDGDATSSEDDTTCETASEEDRKFNYSRVLCHYGSLVAEFRDAWAEGDGERVVRCWKFFMLHFKASGHTKYALEGLRLQFQLQVLSASLAHQIMHHRFVNTRGGLGNNIPCDLYNEHVNKLVKIIIQNMGSNLTEASLQRAVRCVSTLHAICKHFDAATQVPAVTSAHSTKSDLLDIGKVVSVVLQHNLLNKQDSPRKHHFFPEINLNPLDKLDREKLKAWIKKKKTEYGMCKGKYRQREADLCVDESESSSESDSGCIHVPYM